MLDERGEVVRYFLARQHLPAEEGRRVVSVVMERGLAGWVYRHRKGALVEDTRTDDRWHMFDDDEKPVRSVLATPLTRRGMINGLVTLEHQEPGAFNRSDLQLLTAIAHQAAVAIENAHLFTQVSDERDTVASILNTVNDAILVSDGHEHRLAMLNPAAAALFDVPLDDAVGKPLGDLLPDSPLLKLLDQAAEGQAQDVVIELAGAGHHHVRVHEIPRVGRVTVLHDITHFAELDALKSEFVSAVSHDLKNPLGTILGYAWMLDDEAGLSELQRRYVTSILQSVQRMQKLVSNLLDLAKIEAGVDADREPCSVQTVIANVPLGLRTRRASDNARGWSGTCMMPQFESMTSKLASSKGRSWASPSVKCASGALRAACASISDEKSNPVTSQPRAQRAAVIAP